MQKESLKGRTVKCDICHQHSSQNKWVYEHKIIVGNYKLCHHSYSKQCSLYCFNIRKILLFDFCKFYTWALQLYTFSNESSNSVIYCFFKFHKWRLLFVNYGIAYYFIFLMKYQRKRRNNSLSIKIHLYAKIASVIISHICDYILVLCYYSPL